MNKIEEYYVDLQPQVEAFFYAKTANRMLAQDLCQDTFYEACAINRTFN